MKRLVATMGMLLLCALCCLYVDGENVVEFDFGKG